DEIGVGAYARAGSDDERRASIRRAVWAESPRAAHVVLEAGAADGGQRRVAVAINLHLALSVPGGRVDHANADVAAEEAAGTVQSLRDHEVAAQHRRVLAPEGDVEMPEAGGQLRLQRVVDLVVEERAPAARVPELDAHAAPEGQREIAVEAA